MVANGYLTGVHAHWVGYAYYMVNPSLNVLRPKPTWGSLPLTAVNLSLGHKTRLSNYV